MGRYRFQRSDRLNEADEKEIARSRIERLLLKNGRCPVYGIISGSSVVSNDWSKFQGD